MLTRKYVSGMGLLSQRLRGEARVEEATYYTHTPVVLRAMAPPKGHEMPSSVQLASALQKSVLC